VACLRLRVSFVEAVAVTKVLNIFSSLVATMVFAFQGLIDWRLGLIVSTASFTGGLIGGRAARKMNDVWLQRIFLATVITLAVKILLFDVSWTSR
jgi:uncharacterized protein